MGKDNDLQQFKKDENNDKNDFTEIGQKKAFYCSNCGAQVESNWKVCPKCGKTIGQAIENSKIEVQDKKKKKHIFLKVIVVSIIFLIISMMAVGGTDDSETKSDEDASGNISESGTTLGTDVKLITDDNGDAVTMETIDTYLRSTGEEAPFLITEICTSPSVDVAGCMDLSIELVNQTGKNLRNVVVGIAVWDSNGLPIKLHVVYNFSEDDDYVLGMKLENVTADFSDNFCIKIEDTDIGSINAVILEYEDFEGNVWNNPLTTYYKDMASMPVDSNTITHGFFSIVEE